MPPSPTPGAEEHPAPATLRVGSRPREYLIAKNSGIVPLGVEVLDFEWVVDQLAADPTVHVRRTLRPSGLAPLSGDATMLREVVVAAMPEATAAQLRQHPQVVLEEDHLVRPLPSPLSESTATAPLLFSPFGTQGEWQVELRSPSGTAIPGATVYLYGSGFPAQQKTDENGRATLSLLNESDDTLRALYVNPQQGYWSLWVDQPALVSGVVNTVTLTPLAASFPGFPDQQLVGWGQKVMGLEQVPEELDGRGVTVAVIDSGAAALTHPDLQAVQHGRDVTSTNAPGQGWTVDTIAHGSHCTGIIAGLPGAGGIRGFAPAAEVHELRIFPGGRVSSLLEALDYCIEQQIDVVNMSLGTGGTSQIVLQKLAQARELGVACIVAAGNSGDDVQFPGSSPDVLTVAAIGHDGQFPATSYHAQQRWAGGLQDGPLFAAAFSCHGPEVDVCAPGVAVVSSVPEDSFASWDGTSMAAPHVSGLAALVLAHHPDFQSPGLALPTANRVDRLFQILKDSAMQLALGDPSRTGRGLPRAVPALGLQGTGHATTGQAVGAGAIRASLARVRGQLEEAGLMPVAPQSVGPSATPSAAEVRRQLAMVRAQLSQADLLPIGG